MRVLLIEPDVIQAGIYAQALKRAGHIVAQARSAQRAVHLADKKAPDVVVLEMQLPAHNGVEFLYEFRSYAEWLHIPVIVHTSVPATELQHTSTLASELGVTTVLYKPDTGLQELCEAVRKAAANLAESK